MASLLLVETRVHNTWKKLLIVKVSYSLCNVDAKIDGNEGPTLISSTRYSFPFEKVVSINMTRYRQLFPTTFSFSRFFFFLLQLFIRCSSSVTYFLRYYCRDINYSNDGERFHRRTSRIQLLFC